MVNHIEHLRIFNKCYLENGFTMTPAAKSAEEQLFPFFVNLNSEDKSALRIPLEASEGRGIVISISDGEVGRAVSLLRVLCYLRNELPVQFVHLDELSAESTELLQNAATFMSGLDSGKDQQISFLDVSSRLKPGYAKYFKGYNRKWFAALFNTFEEMILMDADAVPFVAPSLLFDLAGYQETGAYFFRDRELDVLLKPWKTNFFKSLIPTEATPFDFAFNSSKLENNFFKFNSKHVAESGMVLINRETHISGLVIPVALQYFKKSGKILYGDKDLFWLGQLIAGNTDYLMHYNTAAAMGISNWGGELCSTQIAHYGEDRLLWSNGGLTKCKKRTWVFDYYWYNFFLFYDSTEELRKSYESPVEVTEIIIPVTLLEINKPGQSQRPISNFNKVKSKGCAATYYCAKTKDGGRLIKLDEWEKEHIKAVILVWTGHVAN